MSRVRSNYLEKVRHLRLSRFCALAVLLTVLWPACVRAKASGGGGAVGRDTQATLSVQRIEVQVTASVPPQVFVRVHGILLDGCTFLDAVEQHRVGHLITVTVATRHTNAEKCTMIAKLVEETIRLQGAFPPGSYTVNVNGTVEKFSL